MNKYKLIKQDTFKKLNVNSIYYIDTKNFNKLYDKDKRFTGFVITEYQIKTMFEAV